ncbi:alpha/beta-hydrolase [Delitschia confertaspora ATCC 74209]|uniref:Alpha/beta-hydrolase n=1 Tax=Delitschia confertaspora ATCC 74209 TaxID=1513339 RepID=A0A9P4JGN1_9PLEO|nr:alpha/beta-hydrolase [Delitschia confertaspora ATCC 74209]
MPLFTLPNEPSVNLYYDTTGPSTASPILLIHGYCSDSHDWSWQIPVLAEKYHVIALENRGHGRSSAPKNCSYGPKLFARDAAALLKYLGYKKDVIVIGHSMGAMAASSLSIQNPELVKAVILLDPPYWLSNERSDETVKHVREKPVEWALLVYTTLVESDTPKWMTTWYNRRLVSVPEHVVLGSLEAIYKEGGEGRAEVCREYTKARKCPRLAIYWKEEGAEQEKALGMGELDKVSVVGGVGHWFHQVRSEETNDILESWLERLESKVKAQ